MSHHQRYDHSDPLFNKLNILKLPNILHLQTCLFVHKALHFFPQNTDFLMENSITRTYNQLRIPLYRTSHAQQNILYRGPKQWNDLPHELRDITTFPLFKRRLKNMLYNKMHN